MRRPAAARGRLPSRWYDWPKGALKSSPASATGGSAGRGAEAPESRGSSDAGPITKSRPAGDRSTRAGAQTGPPLEIRDVRAGLPAEGGRRLRPGAWAPVYVDLRAGGEAVGAGAFELVVETADSDELNYRAELRDAMLRAIGSSRFAIYHLIGSANPDDVGSAYAAPLRVVPELGQVSEYGSECPQSIVAFVSQTPRAGFQVAIGSGTE